MERKALADLKWECSIPPPAVRVLFTWQDQPHTVLLALPHQERPLLVACRQQVTLRPEAVHGAKIPSSGKEEEGGLRKIEDGEGNEEEEEEFWILLVGVNTFEDSKVISKKSKRP